MFGLVVAYGVSTANATGVIVQSRASKRQPLRRRAADQQCNGRAIEQRGNGNRDQRGLSFDHPSTYIKAARVSRSDPAAVGSVKLLRRKLNVHPYFDRQQRHRSVAEVLQCHRSSPPSNSAHSLEIPCAAGASSRIETAPFQVCVFSCSRGNYISSDGHSAQGIGQCLAASGGSGRLSCPPPKTPHR